MENLLRLITAFLLACFVLTSQTVDASSRKEYILKNISKTEFPAYGTLGLGTMERINGNYALALEHTYSALQQLGDINKTDGFLYGLAHAHAGLLSIELGNFKSARAHAEAALTSANRVNNDELRLMSLGELSILSLISDDIEGHNQYRGQVLAILGATEDESGKIYSPEVRERLGQILVFYDSEEFILQAAKNAVLLGDRELATFYLDIILQGNVAQSPIREVAASIMGEVVILDQDFARLEELAQKFQSDYLSGRIHYLKNDFPKAIKAFTASLEHGRFNNTDYVYAKTLYLAKSYEQTGQLDMAIKAYEDANSIIESSRNTLLPGGRKAYLAKNEFNTLRSEAHEGLARIKIRNKEAVSAFWHSELSKCRTLVDALRAKGQSEKSLSPLAKASVRFSYDAAQGVMNFGRGVYFITFDVTETALLRFILYEGECLQATSIPISRQALNTLIQDYTATLSVQRYEDLEKFSPEQSNAVFELLFGGVLPEVAQGSKIVVSPDEILCTVSFPSLVISMQPETFFVERNLITCNYSAMLFSELKTIERKGKSRHVAVVNPIFTKDSKEEQKKGAIDLQGTPFASELPSLPETQTIGDSLQLLFPEKSDVYQGGEATKANLQAVDYDAVSTLVIASHADIIGSNSAVLEPSIYLSPEPATAESYALTLSEIEGSGIAPDCCFLAACQTGLGEYVPGEGPLSFVYAFHNSGTPNVISSLWPVEVSSTVRLVASFYRHLERTTSFSEALWASQLEAAKAKDAHPFFWASFILHGVD